MSLIPVLLIIPLAWALISLLAERFPVGRIAIPGILLQLAASVTLTVDIWQQGAQSYALGSWLAPLGITLVADGLTVSLLSLTALIALVSALYALFYLREYPRQQTYFWPLFWFLLAALNGIWLAGDLFNLYVGLELLGLAAVGMVALKGDKQSLEAALRYLYAALLGSLAYLLGVALVYGNYGSLDIVQLRGLMVADITTQVAIGLMTIGLLIKTAVFPLHYWLPPAHGGALAPVSAILSALVVKASFYILARIWLDAGTIAITVSAAQVMGVLGAGAIVYGSWQAFRQTDIKMLVAYSTVAQLGYLMLVFPLAIQTGQAAAQLAWQGTLIHLLAHGFAKAAMFLSVGTLVVSAARKGIADLAGVSREVPLALFAFGLSAVSLMGLPPSGGFNGKWLLLQSALASSQWWWFIVLAVGSLMTAAYIFRVFRISFVEEADHPFKRTPVMLDVTALALAVLAILLGFFTMVPLTLMEVTDMIPGGGGL